MDAGGAKGTLYRCPVCGAEATVLAERIGEFRPRCCNREMAPLGERVAFYYCPVCGAEIAVIKQGEGRFEPWCCNRPMVRERAEAA